MALIRDEFVAGALQCLRLAIEGAPRLLHSTRALRNLALQNTQGDQDVAGRQLVETLVEGVADDDASVVRACLPAIGLPVSLALPLWQQLRKVALLSEVLGHDASANRGRVLCAVGGIPTTQEPLETAAAHALWHALCRGQELAAAPVADLLGGMADCEGSVADAVLICFAENRRHVPEEEWQAAVDPDLTLRAAKVLAQELLKDEPRRERAEARIGRRAGAGAATSSDV